METGDEAFPEGNFTQAQEGNEKNRSEPFSRNRNTSSGQETSWEEKNGKPSVRKELGDIRKEQEEKRKRPDRRKNARENKEGTTPGIPLNLGDSKVIFGFILHKGEEMDSTVSL